VAHSFGGIVVAQALASPSPDARLAGILDSTAGALFLGTPFHGSLAVQQAGYIDDAAEAFGFPASGALPDRLTPGSEGVAQLKDDFNKLALDRNWDIACFFQQLR